MENEQLNRGPKPQHKGPEGQKVDADDLKFVRSAIEKTYKQVSPDTHPMIMWGIICLITYPAIHFLVKNQLFKWVWAVFLPPVAIGLCYIFVTLILINKREKKAGFVSHLKRQISWVWVVIMVMHGLTWSILGTAFNNYCAGDPGFLFAILFSIALSITGIFHSKEWLYGGMLIFVGALLAFFIKDYGYIILGLATGAGLIIPAIIVQRNYRKKEKCYE
ncbi:MAG: hypothetical protein JXB29_07480 [Sedimentisphaerales bacterium]|nr:hypothetical protein [Sedimentisphaerales bacterium]